MNCKNILLTLIMKFLILTGFGFAQTNFTKIIIDTSFAENSQLSDLNVADLNGDNKLDLIVTTRDYIGDNDAMLWYQNDGNENFTKITIDTTVDLPSAIAVADIDEDSDNDIVLGSDNRGLFLFSNDGFGIFTKSLIDQWLNNFRNLNIIDFDNDNDKDVLHLCLWGIFWEVNDGSQNFVRDTVEAIDIVDRGLFSGDLDGDSDNDIVASIYNENNNDHILVWYQNNGGFVFTKDTIDLSQQTIYDIIVKDLDGDGDDDIITVEPDNNSTMWYINDGEENFTRDTVGLNFKQQPISSAVVDIDNDNDNDVVVTGGDSQIGEVVYYENNGSENFIKHTIDNTLGNRLRIVATDIDRDDDIDLFVINSYPFEVVYYRNDGLTGVKDELILKEPIKFILEQNYPNPFNSKTAISYQLPVESDVELSIYNITGQSVAILVSERQPLGNYRYVWDARYLPSGIYLYRVQAGNFVETKKLLLLR